MPGTWTDQDKCQDQRIKASEPRHAPRGGSAAHREQALPPAGRTPDVKGRGRLTNEKLMRALS